MGRRRCCCAEPVCILLQDDFERSDSTNLGSDWNEESGDWAISSGCLVLSSGTGLVMTTQENPVSRRGWSTVEFNLTGSGPWDFYLVLGADEDGSGGKEVHIEMTSSDCTITAQGQSRTFDTTTAGGTKPSEWTYLSSPSSYFWKAIACYTDDCLYVSLGEYTGLEYGSFHACVWDLDVGHITNGLGYAGIRTNDTTIQFEYFAYNSHRHDFLLRGDDQCPDCTCACGTFGEDYAYVPWRIRIDFYGAAYCTCFNGGYMIMEARICEAPVPANEFWLCTEGTVCGQDMSYSAGGNNFLDCGWDDVLDYILGAALCEMGPLFEASAFQCDPFQIDWAISIADPATECSWCYPATDPDTVYAVATDDT